MEVSNTSVDSFYTCNQAITNLAKKLSVIQLARMVGHRDLKSLMIYYNETATELANLLN